MDWGLLASTALGAVIGIVTTLAADHLRAKRSREERDETARQQLYGDYLAALARTRNHIRTAARDGGLPADERARAAAAAFHESNAYELRYQIAVVASKDVVETSTRVFRALRDLRDQVEDGALHTDQAYVDARLRWDLLLAELRVTMRRDLNREAF